MGQTDSKVLIALKHIGYLYAGEDAKENVTLLKLGEKKVRAIVRTRSAQEESRSFRIGIPLERSADIVVLWISGEESFYVIDRSKLMSFKAALNGKVKVEGDRWIINVLPEEDYLYFTGSPRKQFSLRNYTKPNSVDE